MSNNEGNNILPNESCIYIHCGLHKTATSTIQKILSDHEDLLRSCGILYPRAGRIFRGHHNIGWQLARDRRFRQSAGDIDALFSEIDEFKGRVLLSSEDFESSIVHPDRWEPLSRFARKSGRRLIFILYFRNQASYLESLYQEMLKHGTGEDFISFSRNVLASGELRIKDWEFHFDYWKAVRIILTIPFASVIPRNFHALANNSPIQDLFSALGMHYPLSEEISKLRCNAVNDIKHSMMLYYRNRIERDLKYHEQQAITMLCDRITESVRITGELGKSIENKFVVSNMQLCQFYKIPTTGLLPAFHSQEEFKDDFSIQKVFSFETQITLDGVMSLMSSDSTDGLAIENTIREKLNSWSSWIQPGSHGKNSAVVGCASHGVTESRDRRSALPPGLLQTVQQGTMRSTYKGITCLKNPFDFALYTRLIQSVRPRTIIELGSHQGGSALWLADLLSSLDIDGRVYSIDIQPVEALRDPRIEFLRGDVLDLASILPPRLLLTLPRPLLVIEDSAHLYETTLAVLRFFDPYLMPGEYLVVEDVIVNDMTALGYAHYDDGPNQAIFDFLRQTGGRYLIDTDYCDFYGHNVTYNTNGYLRKLAP